MPKRHVGSASLMNLRINHPQRGLTEPDTARQRYASSTRPPENSSATSPSTPTPDTNHASKRKNPRTGGSRVSDVLKHHNGGPRGTTFKFVALRRMLTANPSSAVRCDRHATNGEASGVRKCRNTFDDNVDLVRPAERPVIARYKINRREARHDFPCVALCFRVNE